MHIPTVQYLCNDIIILLLLIIIYYVITFTTELVNMSIECSYMIHSNSFLLLYNMLICHYMFMFYIISYFNITLFTL